MYRRLTNLIPKVPLPSSIYICVNWIYDIYLSGKSVRKVVNNITVQRTLVSKVENISVVPWNLRERERGC